MELVIICAHNMPPVSRMPPKSLCLPHRPRLVWSCRSAACEKRERERERARERQSEREGERDGKQCDEQAEDECHCRWKGECVHGLDGALACDWTSLLLCLPKAQLFFAEKCVRGVGYF